MLAENHIFNGYADFHYAEFHCAEFHIAVFHWAPDESYVNSPLRK